MAIRGDIFTLLQALYAFSSALNDIASGFLRITTFISMTDKTHFFTCNHTNIYLQFTVSRLLHRAHTLLNALFPILNVAMVTPKEKYGGQ